MTALAGPARTLFLAAAGLGLATAGGTASASGFRLPEGSVAGLGTSNALVANYEQPGALVYNPAVMSFLPGTELVAGVTLINPHLSVDPDNSVFSGDVDSQGRDLLPDPSLAFKHDLGARWSWGLNVYAPFGLETDWPLGTFKTFQDLGTMLANPTIAALEPEHSLIEMANINPSLAVQLGPDTSLGVGVDYYYVHRVKLNTQGARIGGDGDGWGWNAGLLHVAGPWSFGVSYRSAVDAEIEGDVNLLPAETELNFPWMLQAGARYRASDRLAVEFDVERTGWSRFDRIVITDTSGNPMVTSTNDWEDVWAYRFGLTYQLNDRTELRAGYTLDQTPQEDEHFSARVPDSDRHLFSVGFARDMGGWTLEGGYMFVYFKDRDVNAPANSYLAGLGGGNSDPNGTDAYNGEYSAHVHLLGIGISKQF